VLVGQQEYVYAQRARSQSKGRNVINTKKFNTSSRIKIGEKYASD